LATIRKRTWTYAGRKRTAYEFSIVHEGKLSRKQFPTRAEAQDELDKFKDDLKRPAPVEVPTLTLEAASRRYLAAKSRKRSLTEDERMLEHLKDHFGKDTALAEITAGRISQYKTRRLAAVRTIGKGEKAIERRLSIASVNRPLALLRHLLRLAHEEWGVLAAAPKRLKLDREPRRLRWLRPEEAVRLLEACRQSKNSDLVNLVEFALFTGMRQGEILSLKWQQVERACGVVALEADQTKTDEARQVRLNARSDAVLARRWKDGAEYVFESQNWSHYQSAWEAAVRRAKIMNFRFHDLRHTFASWLVQKGRPLKEVQEALGHRTLTMTLRYAHLSADNLRAAVASLEDVIPSDGARLAQDIRTLRDQNLPIGEIVVTSRV